MTTMAAAAEALSLTSGRHRDFSVAEWTTPITALLPEETQEGLRSLASFP
jgi:hypothetical protein